jgi:hypothetical protein
MSANDSDDVPPETFSAWVLLQRSPLDETMKVSILRVNFQRLSKSDDYALVADPIPPELNNRSLWFDNCFIYATREEAQAEMTRRLQSAVQDAENKLLRARAHATAWKRVVEDCGSPETPIRVLLK